MNKIYAIAGAPCSGKTEVINALKKGGYDVIEEVARALAEERGVVFDDKLSQEERRDISNEILDRQTLLEADLPREGTFFIDAGMHDNTVYHPLFNGEPIPEEYINYNNYDTVFFLEPLRDYVNDEVRGETAEVATIIGVMKELAYRNAGCNVVRIRAYPNLDKEASVSARVEDIIRHVVHDS